jgi:hypothetical protein
VYIRIYPYDEKDSGEPWFLKFLKLQKLQKLQKPESLPGARKDIGMDFIRILNGPGDSFMRK